MSEPDGRPVRVSVIVPRRERTRTIGRYAREGFALTDVSPAAGGFVRLGFEKVESDDGDRD